MLEQGKKQHCVYQTWVEFEHDLLCFLLFSRRVTEATQTSNKTFMQPEPQEHPPWPEGW